MARHLIGRYAAPVAAQAPQDESPADILPPPGIHTAVHYAGWLRREAHRHQEPKASVLRQAARMLDALKAECGRLHQELIDSQAPAPDGGALREAVKIAYGYLWHVNNEPGTPNQYAPERAAYKARIVLREQLTKDERGEGINVVRAAMQRTSDGGAA